ncbi:glycosyltransferase family 4 protein [Aeoliella sp. SH292]|uniref:glycosyltransferase family 4 protein n=1 Tax=Aeoliella sp. SH292 TaxID=3454464 RepID=UPI003F972B04
MRIAYIAAGAAGMYCGSCLHDNTLARALMDRGEDIVLVPTYTPLRTDEVDVSIPRVFYGGINVYLQQKIPFFRSTPRWVDWMFDRPWLLNMATRGGPSVDPSKLGDMTVSMLQGELGHQRKELVKLVDWLLDEVKPEVVHLSNSMLLGFARLIAERCGPPVVCSLSGEDIFLEKLTPPYYEQARELLRERARECHAFVSLNEYYANFMSDYLAVDRDKVHVIPHGLDLVGHSPASAPPTRLTVGYLARICHDKGLHLLVEACEHLAKTCPDLDFEVRAAGYLGKADEPYLREIERRVARGPLAGRFKYVGELDRGEKIKFLQSLSVFALPTVYAESKGLPVLEAWANGLPVLLPNHGSFTEMVADTEGGLLHIPHDPHDLAGRLAELLADAELRATLGNLGRQAVVDRYQAHHMAEAHVQLYQQLSVP